MFLIHYVQEVYSRHIKIDETSWTYSTSLSATVYASNHLSQIVKIMFTLIFDGGGVDSFQPLFTCENKRKSFLREKKSPW